MAFVPSMMPSCSSSFSVCISNPIVIQTDIFNAWLMGKSDIDAVDVFATRRNLDRCPELLSVVQSQYRTFDLLEVHLQRPRFFIDQCFFPLPLEIKRTLLELYYTFDVEIARELLDKKMSSRGRRDLDEICAQSGQPLASIRRQFETFKRIHRRVEELPGDLNQNIQRKFLLSKRLSAKYAAIVLLTRHRIEVGRRKIGISTVAVFECAEAFFFHLTLPSKTIEFDYILAREIRELRTTVYSLQSQEELYESMNEAIHATDGEKAGALMDQLLSVNLIKRLLEFILQIGSGLSQANDIRDLCIDINDLIVKTLRDSALERSSVELFFESLPRLYPESTSWRRLITALKLCTVAMLYN